QDPHSSIGALALGSRIRILPDQPANPGVNRVHVIPVGYVHHSFIHDRRRLHGARIGDVVNPLWDERACVLRRTLTSRRVPPAVVTSGVGKPVLAWTLQDVLETNLGGSAEANKRH